MENLIGNVQSVLLTTPARWLRLAEMIPADLLAGSPAPGQWSATDCLRHLLDTEMDVFPVRVRAFLAGQDFAGFDPDTQSRDHAARTPGQLAAEFALRRAESLVLFERLDEADLGRTARHAELGPVTLGQMLHEWAAHDLMHTVQAEQALMQPFIGGSGSWRSYFAAHDASTPR